MRTLLVAIFSFVAFAIVLAAEAPLVLMQRITLPFVEGRIVYQAGPPTTPPAAAAAQTATPKTPTVLFICPHGAAKSVLASAYFKQFAAERGIKVAVDSVGTEPAPDVNAPVAARLEQQGLAVPINKPRPVTANDVAQADIVISIGCDVSHIPATSKLRRWDDVPDLSDNFEASDAAIRAKAKALVDEISRLR